VLPAAGPGAPRADGGHLAADRPDEGPGRRPPCQWRRGDLPELDVVRRRAARTVAGAAAGDLQAALPVAGTSPGRLHGRRTAALVGLVSRGRRGPLHQRVGARLPAGVPSAEGPEGASPRHPLHGPDGHGDDPGAGRHRVPARPPGSGDLRCELQPTQPAVPGRAPGLRLPAGPGVHPQAILRERDRLLLEPGGSRLPGGAAEGRWHPGRPVPCRHGAGGAVPGPGGLPARRHPGGVCDDRVRHGHQQAERPLRGAPRPPQEHRGLLPGDGACRTRWPACRVPAAVQRRGRRQADAVRR
jgi:hypothetical protein